MGTVQALSRLQSAATSQVAADSVRHDDPRLSGWILAGFYKFASALASSGAVSITAYDELMIIMRVVSMSAATDVPALRFNGDTGNNYRSRYIVNNATAGTTLTDVPVISATRAELSGMGSSASRAIQSVINNRAGTPKLGVVTSAIGSGSATLQVKIDLAGHFEWVNSAAQITSVEMRSSGGSVTFGTDSGMLIFGRNLAA